MQLPERTDPEALARVIADAVAGVTERSAGTMRPVRREASKWIRGLGGSEVLRVASLLLESHAPLPRWFVYELVHHHGPAMAELDAAVLIELGRGISSWGEVDAFAHYLAGMAWSEGRVSDAQVNEWARSEDRWWRRVAVVSTIPLNRGARGGRGDARRTIEVCELLRVDRDDRVVKAVAISLSP